MHINRDTYIHIHTYSLDDCVSDLLGSKLSNVVLINAVFSDATAVALSSLALIKKMDSY